MSSMPVKVHRVVIRYYGVLSRVDVARLTRDEVPSNDVIYESVFVIVNTIGISRPVEHAVRIQVLTGVDPNLRGEVGMIPIDARVDYSDNNSRVTCRDVPRSRSLYLRKLELDWIERIVGICIYGKEIVGFGIFYSRVG